MCHVNRLQTDKGKDVDDWRGPQFCTFKYLKEFGGFNDCRNLLHKDEFLIEDGERTSVSLVEKIRSNRN